MKIQLVFAPPKSGGSFAEMSEGVMPPLGILSVAAYVRDRMPGLELRVTDGLRAGFAATLAEIERFQPRILGISINTPCALSAYALIDAVKARRPETFVVTGGPHATALPEECLTRSQADAVVRGEGEETFLELCRAVAGQSASAPPELGAIAGIAFRDGPRVAITPTRPYIPSLDSIPFPARDLLDLPSYQGWYLTRQPPDTPMLFSRGCAFRCTFCSNKVWNLSEPRLRFRSPDSIADEMAFLKERYGIREVFDNSDEFNNSLTHAKAVCRKLIERKLGLTWKTQLRAKPLDEELVSLMAESGCWYVHLGIESGNEATLRGTRKGVTLPEVEAACALLKKHGIRVLGLFMLFNAWEEDGELRFEDAAMTERTLSFAEGLYRRKLMDYFGWSITMPYPGSPLYDIALKHGIIKPHLADDWDRWVREEFSVLNLPGVSDRDVARLKTRGSWLRARCMLRSGGFGLKDALYIARKALRVVKNELVSGPRESGGDGPAR